MADANSCPRCGATLPPDAPAGVCPKCLLAVAMAGDTDVRQQRSDEAPTTPLSPSMRFVPPQPEELAKLFPQLEILELIGAGGMGAVYRARQPGLDRMVAVKILPPEVGADPAFAQRFTREAQALARLGHQHIVSVYDFGNTGGLYYFIMEYVDGANLRHLIKSGGLQPTEALAIVPQICEALQFAHDEGIVHRDIKPENILLDKRGRVKIADFGLARLLGTAAPEISLTGTNQVLGTLHYMAPEQIQGLRTVDHRADIYSLGVVFYEMLTGELPLGRFASPSQKVELDVRLDEVVLRSLEAEPQRRYQRANDVKTDLESISNAPQSTPMPPPVSDIADEALIESVRQRVILPAMLLVAAGVVTLFLAAAGVRKANSQLGPNASYFGDPGSAELLAFMFTFAISPVMIAGGEKMLRLTSRRWAIAAAVMMFMPGALPQLLPWTVPLGIWVLILLNNADVKQAFALRKQRTTREAAERRIAQWLEKRNKQNSDVKPNVDRIALKRREMRDEFRYADESPTSNVLPELEARDDLNRGNRGPTGSESADIAAEREGDAEMAEIVPYRVIFAACALFGVGWVFVGIMWNSHWPGLVAAIAVMAALTYCVVRWKLVYLPKLRSELARVPRWVQRVKLAVAVVAFVITMSYVFEVQLRIADSTMGNAFLLTGHAYGLLGNSEKFGKMMLAFAEFPSVTGDKVTLQTTAAKSFSDISYITIDLCFLLFFYFCAVVSLIDTRRYRFTWKHWWLPTLQIVASSLLMLLIVHGVHRAMVGRSTTKMMSSQAIRFDATLDEVEAAIDRWATQHKYIGGAYHHWRIINDEIEVGELHMTCLKPTLWFERYQASWAHIALRPQPPIRISVIAIDDPARVHVHFDLPEAAIDSPEETDWLTLLEGLKAEIQLAAKSGNKGGVKK